MAKKSVSKKINVTKNYRLFTLSKENRIVNVKKHKPLRKSMQQCGFLSCFPIVCTRDENKHLVIKDGQHRLAIAEELGLPVYWCEEETPFNIAIINCTSVGWGPQDHAEKYANQDIPEYTEGLEYAKTHGLPVGTAFSLLGGTTTFGNIKDDFVHGKFKIKDREWADRVASIYGPITTISKKCRKAAFVSACMAVGRVKDIDIKRLIAGAERCRDKLVAYSTRDAYLDMLEEIYNFGRKQLFGLKAAANMAMKERNILTNGNGKNKT